MTDEAIKRAIGKVDGTEQPTAIKMQQFQIRLHTGRPAMLAVPADITTEEALGVIFQALVQMDQLMTKNKTKGLIVPAGAIR